MRNGGGEGEDLLAGCTKIEAELSVQSKTLLCEMYSANLSRYRRHIMAVYPWILKCISAMIDYYYGGGASGMCTLAADILVALQKSPQLPAYDGTNMTHSKSGLDIPEMVSIVMAARPREAKALAKMLALDLTGADWERYTTMTHTQLLQFVSLLNAWEGKIPEVLLARDNALNWLNAIRQHKNTFSVLMPSMSALACVLRWFNRTAKLRKVLNCVSDYHLKQVQRGVEPDNAKLWQLSEVKNIEIKTAAAKNVSYFCTVKPFLKDTSHFCRLDLEQLSSDILAAQRATASTVPRKSVLKTSTAAASSGADTSEDDASSRKKKVRVSVPSRRKSVAAPETEDDDSDCESTMSGYSVRSRSAKRRSRSKDIAEGAQQLMQQFLSGFMMQMQNMQQQQNTQQSNNNQ